MASQPPVICLEFNELTPWLMDQFIAEGKLPHFERLKAQSIVQTSDAQATGEWLNPWVQWVTIHSGLPAEEHGVFRLSNAYKLETPAIWDLVSDAGHSVWVCGSMNPWHRNDLNGYLLPDAWSQQVRPFPEGEFDSFYTFVQRNVQEYAASKVPLSRADILRFVNYLATHGLKPATALRIVAQLVRERVGNHRWRRASFLDAIQLDVFEWYFRKHQPAFSTFFVNSTAHYQHIYWRNMRPDQFEIQPTAAEQRDYKDAILFGYQEMDRLVGRFMKLAPHATLMLLTGLGQQPFTRMDSTGGKRIFRVHEQSIFTDKLGLSGKFNYEPLMADEFVLRFENPSDAAASAERLRLFRLPSGKEAFTAEANGCELVGQCRCRELAAPEAFVSISGTEIRIPFAEIFYRVDCVKSGFHHPDGIWWIRLPERVHAVTEDKLPLVDIAPTILDLLGIDKPAFMPGASCLPGIREFVPAAGEPAQTLALAH